MKTNDDAAVSREVFVIKQCILARKTEVAKMDRKYWVCVIKRLVVPAIILFAVVMIALGIACYVISSDTVINNRIEIWIDACQYVDFFLPLVLCMVFVPFIFVQNSNGFIQYASIRTNRRRYIASQMICIMIVVLIGTAIAYGFFTYSSKTTDCRKQKRSAGLCLGNLSGISSVFIWLCMVYVERCRCNAFYNVWMFAGIVYGSFICCSTIAVFVLYGRKSCDCALADTTV